MQFTTHLSFDGNCRQAFDFYAETFGARIVARVTYGEMPGSPGPAALRDRIAHARLDAGGQTLMGADAPPERASTPHGFAVCATIEDLGRAQRIFETLAANGQTQMPFQETFWARGFGMCVDRFGVPWMVNCEKPREGAH